MKVCALLFSLLDINNTNHLEEYQIRALLNYLTNIHENQMLTIIFKLGIKKLVIIQLKHTSFLDSSQVQIWIDPVPWN